MKKPLLTICFMLLATFAWSHTFLITTIESPVKQDKEQDIKERLAVLENGIMDSLFDSGHIFFSNRRNLDETSDTAFSIAQEGGAEFIIEIYYEEETELIHYFLYDALKEKLISTETFSSQEVDIWKRGSVEDFYYTAGEYISHKVYILL